MQNSDLTYASSLVWQLIFRSNPNVAIGFQDENLSAKQKSELLIQHLPLTSPWIMAVMIAGYLAVIFAYLPDKNAKHQKLGSFARFLIFLHNAVLAAYSFIVFRENFPVVLGCIKSHASVSDAFQHCDALVGPHTIFWMWTFYLSKYYEFLDTFIHLYRGARPAFLQVYHHIGVVVLQWLGFYFINPTCWMMIVFNSFVHTLMYSYYAVATYGWKFPVKQLITSIQLFQFVIFQVIAFSYYMPWNNPTLSETQLYSLAYTQIYVFGLIYLFSVFFYKSYFSKQHEKAE